MPNQMIKKFYADPGCSVCGRNVKGWARAQCDNCGATVCRKHRPLFSRHWQCPRCQSQQQQFIGNPQVVQVHQQLPSVQGLPMTQVMQAADTLLVNQRTAEADTLIDELFVAICKDDESCS
jgi:hypothetical protein